MRKKKHIRNVVLLAAAAAVISLSGCLDAETEILVKKDGSGRVKQTFLMKNEFVDMIGAMQGQENYSLLNEEELREKPGAMGKGVTFIEAAPLERNGFSGYTVLYGFKDIEELRLNQNPGEALPDEASGEDSNEEIVRFSFEGGRTNKLTIRMPEAQLEKDDGAEPSVPKEEQEEFIEAFQEMYRDMKFAMYVTVDGTITGTNATYLDGNTVTLMEINFAEIADNPEKIKELARFDPDTMEELKAFIADIPAMKGELQEEVGISFR